MVRDSRIRENPHTLGINHPTPLRHQYVPGGTIKQQQPSTRSVYIPRPFGRARTTTKTKKSLSRTPPQPTTTTTAKRLQTNPTFTTSSSTVTTISSPTTTTTNTTPNCRHQRRQHEATEQHVGKGTSRRPNKKNTDLSPPPLKQNHNCHHHHRNKTRSVTTITVTESRSSTTTKPRPPKPQNIGGAAIFVATQ
ncbi:hypothetical protein QL285_068603 [Trifolium repens]|nr:hypothetical protein QL285_068603 [Trifolium repens]